MAKEKPRVGDRGLRPPLLCPKNPSDFLVEGRRSQGKEQRMPKKSFGFFGRRPQVAGCRMQKMSCIVWDYLIHSY
jgi:hypothetical protein